jgi:hypothetical protein
MGRSNSSDVRAGKGSSPGRIGIFAKFATFITFATFATFKKKGLGWKSGPVFKIQYPMKNRGKDTMTSAYNHIRDMEIVVIDRWISIIRRKCSGFKIPHIAF